MQGETGETRLASIKRTAICQSYKCKYDSRVVGEGADNDELLTTSSHRTLFCIYIS